MKVLTKHVFPIYRQIYKGIKLPNNYVDGIVIKSDRNMTIPIGTKCIYSRHIKDNKHLIATLPFPIKHNSYLYDGEFTIPSSYLATLGESSLLYNHNMLYVNEDTKASDIDVDKILLNTTRGISTTVVIDHKYYNINFLNKLLKLPYTYRSTIFSLNKENPERYLLNNIKKLYIGITILNLNDCKPSFSNNFEGVGIKVQTYQYSVTSFRIYKTLVCLYSNNSKDLCYMDGIKTPKTWLYLTQEIAKINKYIKVQKRSMNKPNEKYVSKCTDKLNKIKIIKLEDENQIIIKLKDENQVKYVDDVQMLKPKYGIYNTTTTTSSFAASPYTYKY